MKDWYQNRMAQGLSHRGQNIPEGKKLYLTEAQKKIHNAQQEKVAKCDAPKESVEAGVLADWDEYTRSFSAKDKSESEKEDAVSEVASDTRVVRSKTTDTKGKSSLKTK